MGKLLRGRCRTEKLRIGRTNGVLSYALLGLLALGFFSGSAPAQTTGSRYFEVVNGSNSVTTPMIYVDNMTYLKVNLGQYYFRPDPRGGIRWAGSA